MVISDDQIKRALFRDLPNAAKNTFLQLEVTPPYSTGPLHDLCVEVIHRHERLEASMITKDKSVNFVRDYSASKDKTFTGIRRTLMLRRTDFNINLRPSG